MHAKQQGLLLSITTKIMRTDPKPLFHVSAVPPELWSAVDKPEQNGREPIGTTEAPREVWAALYLAQHHDYQGRTGSSGPHQAICHRGVCSAVSLWAFMQGRLPAYLACPVTSH